MQITLEDVSNLPPECDGLALTFSFDYHAPMLGGDDHPDEIECVEIHEITSESGEDLTYLMNTHKRYLEDYVLAALKDCRELDIEF
jgi:hypothetical protein